MANILPKIRKYDNFPIFCMVPKGKSIQLNLSVSFYGVLKSIYDHLGYVFSRKERIITIYYQIFIFWIRLNQVNFLLYLNNVKDNNNYY